MNEADAADIIHAIREHYAERLASEFVRLRGVHSERIYTEAALRRSDGELATEGESQLGTRTDVVVPSASQFLTVDSTSVPSFSPFRLSRGSADFIVSPFQWDWCIVTLVCAPDAFAWQPILDWFHRWFDADDTKLPDESGLCGIVHFLDEPRHSNGSISIITDLGSAPVEAFYSLLDACAESRPHSAHVANVQSPATPPE